MPDVAVPPVPSAYATVISFPLAASRVTVKVRSAEPLSPSVTLGASIESEGSSSSSVIVPVPLPAVADTVAFVGLLRATTTVSSGSSVVSPVTDTVTVLLVSPAANVSVPEDSAV